MNRENFPIQPTLEFRSPELRWVPIPGFLISATAESSGAAEFFEIPDTIDLFRVHRLKVVNTTGTAASFSLSAVPSSATIGVQYREVSALNVPANDVIDVTDFIKGLYEKNTMLRAWSGTGSSLVVGGYGAHIL
jgi:hypothetical protein